MLERIQKILSARGVASRRHAEEMIVAGRVSCNGQVCRLGDCADAEVDEISVDGKIIPAFEVMILTPAIRNLIREGKTHQIDGMIYASTNESIIAMDTSIQKLYRSGVIDKKTAIANASNPEMMMKKLI